MPNYALAGGEEDIGRDKPADFGVIVPALEVVETRLLVRQSSDCRYTHIHSNDIAGCIIAEAEDIGAAAGTHRHAYKKTVVVIIVRYGAV